mmetsp:Transcript_62953/g.150104  ORF Transcript_62953/g.150104 Transcript_62953/m.150104 type:complete len:202 (+) Transcript_62953:267-872(+)
MGVVSRRAAGALQSRENFRTSQFRKETFSRARKTLWCATMTTVCSERGRSQTRKRSRRPNSAAPVSLLRATFFSQSFPTFSKSRTSRSSWNMSSTTFSGDPVSQGTSPVSCKSGMRTIFCPCSRAHGPSPMIAVCIVRLRGETIRRGLGCANASFIRESLPRAAAWSRPSGESAGSSSTRPSAGRFDSNMMLCSACPCLTK